MKKVTIQGKAHPIRDSQAIGKGGEADVFDLGDGTVLKLFKPPDHPDFQGFPNEQEGARQRIEEQQSKLPAFPDGLPDTVVTPLHLATKGRRIVGYTMPFIDGTEPLLRYGQKSFRQAGVSDALVIQLFRALYQTIQALHDAGVVIGDFNDLNILIKDTTPHLVDADSMQFGSFSCRVFTARFVDPLLCDPAATTPLLVRPHNALSDWYAYQVMLMQSLLFVGPYGGVYKPRDPAHRIPHDARPLHRITVWHPEVRYPKPGRPLDVLPDTMIAHFRETFEKNHRAIPPLRLLDALQFDPDGKLLLTTKPAVTPRTTKTVATGGFTANKVFTTPGRIVYAAHQGGKLLWLYHVDGIYKREDGTSVVEGALLPNIRFRIAGSPTILARGNSALLFSPDQPDPELVTVDTLVGQLPLIDANAQGLIYAAGGFLNRTSAHGIQYGGEKIGEILPNQTLFWADETLGFGFYRAGRLVRYFVFDPRRRGLNDTVELPTLTGQLVDSTCTFGKELIWLFLAMNEGGRARNRCFAIDARGQVLATAAATAGDGSWLGRIHGTCAAGTMLFVPTDEGVVRVQIQGTSLVVTKSFPDTARVVDSAGHLFVGNEGLISVNDSIIWKIAMK